MTSYHKLVGILAGSIVLAVLLLLAPERTCKDGWKSPSIGRQGACSHHGGVGGDWYFLFTVAASLASGVFAARVAHKREGNEEAPTRVAEERNVSDGETSPSEDSQRDLLYVLDGRERKDHEKLIAVAISRGATVSICHVDVKDPDSGQSTVIPSRFITEYDPSTRSSHKGFCGQCTTTGAELYFIFSKVSNIAVRDA